MIMKYMIDLNSCVNSKAWQTHKGILVEDYLITCLPHVRNILGSGARYKVAFSRRFPHFEVSFILVNLNV